LRGYFENFGGVNDHDVSWVGAKDGTYGFEFGEVGWIHEEIGWFVFTEIDSEVGANFLEADWRRRFGPGKRLGFDGIEIIVFKSTPKVDEYLPGILTQGHIHWEIYQRKQPDWTDNRLTSLELRNHKIYCMSRVSIPTECNKL
jgi:hypothetical protein